MARLAPLLLGAFGLLMLLLVASSFLGSSGFGYDFNAYDSAARRLAAGQPLYPPGIAEAYNSGSYEGLYLYPPPLAAALAPLTFLARDSAAIAWLALRIAGMVLACALLPIGLAARAALLGVASLSFPVWYDLNLGNISVLLFLLSAVVWRFHDRKIGAVALAAAGMLRYPFGIVLIGLALARRWRQVGWTIVAGVLIGVATLPVVGVGGWLDYLAAVRSLGDVSSGPHNLNLGTTAAALGLPGPGAFWVGVQVVAAALATAYAALRRDRTTALVVSLAATILSFPFFHPHYLVQLLIPAAFLAGRGQWWGLVLPLLGWLPGELMAPAAMVGMLVPLVPAGFAATRAIRRAGEPVGAAAGS